MYKYILIGLLFVTQLSFSQIDYSDSWEDFYSYHNVKDFVKANNKIYAIVDNAVFVYDLLQDTNKKISSVNGLSGSDTSAMFYDSSQDVIVIGYEDGLLEVVNANGTITVSKDIVNLAQPGSKRINHFSKYGDKLFVSTPFAIIEYNIVNLEFGDTFYIGNGSSSIVINQTIVKDNVIYAITENGIFTADVNHPYLIDFNNWQQPSGDSIGNFTNITFFNNVLYVAKGTDLYSINNNNLILLQTFPENIKSLKSGTEFLIITLENKVFIKDVNLNTIETVVPNAIFDFDLHTAYAEDDVIYLGTKTYGILMRLFSETDYAEIHPEGPLFNSVFSIEVEKGNLWVVYGGQDYSTYNFNFNKKGFSHFNGENWINTRYNDFPEPILNLLDISIDPFDINHVFLSSYYHGLVEIQDDVIINRYTFDNSPLERWFLGNLNQPNAVLVSATDFDKDGNLWITNSHTYNRIKKLDKNGNWSVFSVSELITATAFGLGDLRVDRFNNVWMGTRESGVIIFNESGEKKTKLATGDSHGDLPDDNVRAFNFDRNSNAWIGTRKGFRVLRGTTRVFDDPTPVTQPITIKLEGATGEEQGQIVLGEQSVNTIAIDGADNKWFGTNSSGVLGTDPSATEELYLFNKDNSPLPSDIIYKIKVDNTTGKVYFATANGIVAFKSNVAPFGDILATTYVYPNPATKNDEFITIDGLNGTHLPRGTNVKIVDSSGYLVYESNVVEGQELKGGKVIWNKRNLAGKKVSSGVYVVLLTLPDTSETSVTKIAIIN